MASKMRAERQRKASSWLSNNHWTIPQAIHLKEFLIEFKTRLREPRFWVVQAMVIFTTTLHTTGEVYERETGHELGKLFLVVLYCAYFVPIIYASLNFGRAGAIPTAAWSGLLAVPNIALLHKGLDRPASALQYVMMLALATIIATRVDKEIAARKRAEESDRSRRVSAARYSELFKSAGEAILVFDRKGMILEANAAALALLAGPRGRLQGRSLTNVLGRHGASILLRTAWESGASTPDLRRQRADGSDVWLQPLCAPVPTEEGTVLVQALLRDVTERRGLEHYAQEIVRAQEEERQRIAQELHDVSVQSVVVLCRDLDAIEETRQDELPKEVRSALGEARMQAEAIADELRRFSRDLRPLILDDLGLLPALRHLVSELSDRSGVPTSLSITGTPRRLSADAELALYRIAQEALRNAERHSDCRSVKVRLGYRADSARLTVTDDGMGFNVPRYASLATLGRLGLVGMRERARRVGGTCEIRSEPGSGTRVEALIPCVAVGAQPVSG